MESTLSVTDAAYNSGRRSRSNSFNSQTREDLLQPTHPELSPDPHSHAAAEATSNAYLNDDLAAFRSHRRHASDVSDISAHVAISPSSLALPYASASDRAQSHSPLQPATIFSEDNGLDEAFNSSLFMADDYTDASTNPYFQQQQKQTSYAAQQPYAQDMAQQSADSQYYMHAYANAMNAQLALPQGLTTSEAAALMQDPNFNNPAIFGESPALDQQQQQVQQQSLQMPFGSRPASRTQRPAHGSFSSGSESQLNRSYSAPRTDQSQHSSPAWPRRHMQSPPAMLNVPGRENVYQTAGGGERTSPYSETHSFDGSLNDLGSPAATGPPLSRSNSIHSQFSPQYDACLASTPNSPFVAHDNYVEAQRPEAFMGNFESAYSGLSPAQVYQILGNYNDLRAAQGSMAFAPASAIPMPNAADAYNAFEAPDIAINPPTPSGASYMSRAQPRHYPFPQPVPIITTTTAPSTFDIEQPDYHDPDSLGVDRHKQQRGRSHSDSRLMVHPGQVRSRSNSSHHSSSSRSPSRQHHLSGSPGLLQKPAGGRISKPGIQHRRASWSGAPDDDEHDDETDVESTVSSNKQKNPATFICPVEGCGKAFTRAYNLRSHQRTHTNERPFLCEICNKGFARQHDRKRHEKLHSNERPFSCPGCKKKFARMDALSRHFKSEMGKDCIIGNPEYEHFLLDDDT